VYRLLKLVDALKNRLRTTEALRIQSPQASKSFLALAYQALPFLCFCTNNDFRLIQNEVFQASRGKNMLTLRMSFIEHTTDSKQKFAI